MLEVVPSILTNDPQELRQMISACENVVKRVSIDIIDGVFADNKTIDPSYLRYIDSGLELDFQLMTKEPINWVEKCASANADRIIGHVEMMQSQVEFLEKVQEVNRGCGLALDLATSVDELDKSVLFDLDVVLVMSVRAGFGGQKFREEILGKISSLNKIRKKDKKPFRIHVDGGINAQNIKSVVEAGADEVSVGRSIFSGGNVEDNVKLLLEKSKI